MSETRRTAAIMRHVSDAGDGHPSFGVEAAVVMCANCEGWEGTVCPTGCGVRLVSVQAEKDAECRGRMLAEQAERVGRRAARRAAKATS